MRRQTPWAACSNILILLGTKASWQIGYPRPSQTQRIFSRDWKGSMDTLLIKIFATALTFSQVVSSPDTLKTRFDPTQNRQQVIDLLRAGCGQVRKAFDVETINLDDLITTAMEDPEAAAREHA